MKAPRTSIRHKLVATVLWTSSLSLVLTGAVFIAHEVSSYRSWLVQVLGVRSGILAANVTAALAFDNREDATGVLSALRADRYMVRAALYDENGELFAVYPPGTAASQFPRAPGPSGEEFQREHVAYYRPVLDRDRPVGTLYLLSSLAPLQSRIRAHALVVLLAILGSLGVAFLVASWLQGGITKPVHALAEAARAVTEKKDYTVRVREIGDDEVGLLTEAFNSMLDQIEERDTEIRELNADLERRVVARTAELAASNKELEAFSYSVAHDLRTPLRAIDGFSKVLADDMGEKLGETGRSYLDRVRGAARQMGLLIDDLLNLARLSRAEMHREPVDLSRLGSQIASDLRQAQPERDVSFVIADGLTTEGDAQLLRVALDNLLRNAWKFTSKHVTARIEVGRSQDNGSTIYYVRDDGAGFDMAHSNLLFSPFQRLHRQTEFEGTGVGLATVQRIIQRHKGRLWAEGAVENGATFYFTLWEGGVHV